MDYRKKPFAHTYDNNGGTICKHIDFIANVNKNVIHNTVNSEMSREKCNVTLMSLFYPKQIKVLLCSAPCFDLFVDFVSQCSVAMKRYHDHGNSY